MGYTQLGYGGAATTDVVPTGTTTNAPKVWDGAKWAEGQDITFPSGATDPTIAQAQTASVNAADLTVQPQGSAAATGVPGSFVMSLQPKGASGTTYPYAKVTYNGNFLFGVGTTDGSSSQGWALTVGGSLAPTDKNYLWNTDYGNVYWNAPAGVSHNFIFGAGGGGTGFYGSFRLEPNGICSFVKPLRIKKEPVTTPTTGTVTLAFNGSAVWAVIHRMSMTLTGDVVVQYPDEDCVFWLDTHGLTLSGHTATARAGAAGGTVSLTSGKLYMILLDGAGGIVASAG